MKILCAEYNPEGKVAIVPVGDDALLRNNDDFYLPDFAKEFSCIPQFVVRICKLGKSVGERFAGRYYEEVGVGVRFYADDLTRQLASEKLPLIMAASFDGSAAISRLMNKQACDNMEFVFSVNGKDIFQGTRGQLPLSIDGLIALASDYHTLKIGDFLFCGHTFRYRGLELNDRIQVRLNGEEFMNFKLR